MIATYAKAGHPYASHPPFENHFFFFPLVVFLVFFATLVDFLLFPPEEDFFLETLLADFLDFFPFLAELLRFDFFFLLEEYDFF